MKHEKMIYSFCCVLVNYFLITDTHQTSHVVGRRKPILRSPTVRAKKFEMVTRLKQAPSSYSNEVSRCFIVKYLSFFFYHLANYMITTVKL